MLFAGCASFVSNTAGQSTLAGPAVELTQVPFFPQSRYQCGPAALATALAASGVAVTPEPLVEQLYVPGRRGSFQVEMKAAARRYGRIPYELQTGVDGLRGELAAGRPVLVLQNLAFDWAPRWHYAVVVGHEQDGRRVVLRSGRTERQVTRWSSFQRTWSLAERWGIVLLRPGELPAVGDPATYLEAVVAAGDQLVRADVAAALAAGLTAWPANADLNFAAANVARDQGDDREAMDLYQRTLALAPAHVGALNNLADLLSTLGCQTAAQTMAERGLKAAGDSALASVLGATLAEITVRRAADRADAPWCAALTD